MKHTKLRAGFTIVEILIVIVVIAILALITAASYNNARVQAEDAELADGADKISDALQLWIAKNGRFPRGGIGSSAAIGSATECAAGANGYFTSGAYPCTAEDTLVASGYLPAGFAFGAQENVNWRIMVYDYTNKAMVYYDAQDTSAKDTERFNAQLTKCGLNPAGAIEPRDSAGMDNGICFVY